MATETKKYQARVILIGEAGAGKSSLFYRIKHKQYRGSSRGTSSTDGASSSVHSRGYDSCVRTMVLSPETHVNMTIMDSVHSQERGQSISSRFYHRVQVVMLVCSLDNEQSLLRLPFWIEEARSHIKMYSGLCIQNRCSSSQGCGYYSSFHMGTQDQKIIFIVVGAKADISDRERDIPPESLEAFGAYHSLPFCEVSAKTGNGVSELLRLVAEKVSDQHHRCGTGRSAGSSRRRGEETPLLTESYDKDGKFVTTRDVSSSFCSCCAVM